jgi:MoxR-like ATPase
MTWDSYYRGDGVPRDVTLPDPPPWRTFPRRPDSPDALIFLPPDGLRDAVNAALCLRRPLLLTGMPGSGKSTLIGQVARELNFGDVLHWHITSRSTLAQALYRYDALGRIYAQRLQMETGTGSDDIGLFLELGPLGSALVPSDRPRALLIDELDKSDVDLPGDLLDVLERGEFEIPEIIRERPEDAVSLRLWRSNETYGVSRGRVQCTEFPFIVMTSNAEQEFPPAFLRRCVRFTMPQPTARMLRDIIRGWLSVEVPGEDGDPLTGLVESFVQRVKDGEVIAVDQLLNTVHLLSGAGAVQDGEFERLRALLMGDLAGA